MLLGVWKKASDQLSIVSYKNSKQKCSFFIYLKSQGYNTMSQRPKLWSQMAFKLQKRVALLPLYQHSTCLVISDNQWWQPSISRHPCTCCAHCCSGSSRGQCNPTVPLNSFGLSTAFTSLLLFPVPVLPLSLAFPSFFHSSLSLLCSSFLPPSLFYSGVERN